MAIMMNILYICGMKCAIAPDNSLDDVSYFHSADNQSYEDEISPIDILGSLVV